MDDADVVVERAEREMTFALRAFRSAAASRPASGDGWCMMCGEEIPKARRDLFKGGDCCTCVECQEKLEQGMGR